MRIRITNYVGMNVWYRQEGTSECLLLPADASAAYSWLSLANSPFYQLRFAMEDPHQKHTRQSPRGKEQSDNGPANEDPRWCDPCSIKRIVITGRFFGGHGFLWVCVELSGLQTIVTICSSLTVRNYCAFPVRFKLNDDAREHVCARSDELYQDAHLIQGSTYHHPNCISLDGSACTLSKSTRADVNISRVMVESVSSVNFGIDGGSWCSVTTRGCVPSEFDLVKISDGQAEGPKKIQCSFAVLRSENPGETTQYAWAKIRRVQCKIVLPTDFDPLQPHVSRRYTWMEVSFWSAVTVENTMDISVEFSFSQKATTMNVKIAPSSVKSLSGVNPFEPVDVQLQYEDQTSAQTSLKPLKFLLKCSTPVKDFKDHIFDFDGCRVIASFCDNHCLMIRLKTERILNVANMTPNILDVSISSPLGNEGAVQTFDSCTERSVGFSGGSDRLVVSIAAIGDPTSEPSLVEWSPYIALNVKGDIKRLLCRLRERG